jgi:hypothetical protein
MRAAILGRKLVGGLYLLIGHQFLQQGNAVWFAIEVEQARDDKAGHEGTDNGVLGAAHDSPHGRSSRL